MFHGKKHMVCRGKEPECLKRTVRENFLLIESQLLHFGF